MRIIENPQFLEGLVALKNAAQKWRWSGQAHEQRGDQSGVNAVHESLKRFQDSSPAGDSHKWRV